MGVIVVSWRPSMAISLMMGMCVHDWWVTLMLRNLPLNNEERRERESWSPPHPRLIEIRSLVFVYLLQGIRTVPLIAVRCPSDSFEFVWLCGHKRIKLGSFFQWESSCCSNIFIWILCNLTVNENVFIDI